LLILFLDTVDTVNSQNILITLASNYVFKGIPVAQK